VGGVLRDVLSGRVPGILYRSGDFYASAAAVGAGAVWIVASFTSVAPSGTVTVGALVTLAVRFGSRALGLSLPVPREPT